MRIKASIVIATPNILLLAAVCAASACAFDARPLAAVQSRLAVADSVAHLGAMAVEPMLAQHPSGVLFLSGYGHQASDLPKDPTADWPHDPLRVPNLWRSDDGGASWRRVDVGTADDGAAGNSDVDLAIGPDGAIYFVVMGYDVPETDGTHITIGVSRDLGASWDWTFLSRDRFDDRPWVEVAPDGTAHVIWNDGNGVSHAVSTDAGRSWSERDRIHPLGGSSHLAVGPAGEIAVRISPTSASADRQDPEADFIATSIDGGRTWTKHAPPAALTWSLRSTWRQDSVNRWVEPLAWDAAGNLYHLWSEGRDLWLGRSADRGATWERWSIASDRERVLFPYLVARRQGELAATWYSGKGESLRGHVALITLGSVGAAPAVARAEPIAVNAWVPADEAVTDIRRWTAGEYFPVTFLRNGDVGVATTILNFEPEVGFVLGFTWWRFERR